MDIRRKGAIRTTFAVTLLILASKLFGFIREMVFSGRFGTSAQSDAYLMAYGVLSVVVLMLASCTSSTFIPVYSRIYSQDGPGRANQYVNSILNIFNLLAIALSLLCVFAAQGVVELFAPGFKNDPQKLALTVQMTRIMFPSLIFFNISNVLSSYLNARERFLPPQLVGFALSLCLITAAVFFADQYGIAAISYATAASAILQVLILLPFLGREYRYLPRLRLRDASVRRTFALAFPALLGMTINEINFFVDRSVSSTLPSGHLSALNYAYRIITFATGVLIVPMTTVLFSRLSDYAARNARESVLATSKQAIEAMSLIIFPVTALSILFGREVVQALFMRGSFDAQSLALTAPAFTMYACGLIFYGVRDLLTRTYYALQDTATPMLLAGVSAIVNAVLDITLGRLWGVAGIAFATAAAAFTGAMTLLFFLRRKLGRLQLKRTLTQLALILLATAAMTGAVLLLKNLLPIAHPLWRAFVFGALGLALYFGFGLLLRVRELSRVFQRVCRRLKRGDQ